MVYFLVQILKDIDSTNMKRSVLPVISEKRIGFNPGYPQQAENPHSY